MKRLAFGRESFADVPEMRAAISKRNGLFELGNRREAQKLPFVGLTQQKAGQVVHVNALHDDYDGAGPFVVEARQQGIGEPLIGCGTLCF